MRRVGERVAGLFGPRAVRQPGSCACHLGQVLQGQIPDAPPQMPVLLRGLVSISVVVGIPARGAKHAGRRLIT